MPLQSHVNYQEPASLFEHFIIAGLHPDANLQTAEAAFIKRKKWETDMISYGITDMKLLQQKGPPIPTLEPQVEFMTAYEASCNPLFCSFLGAKLCFLFSTGYMTELWIWQHFSDLVLNNCVYI